MVGNTGEVVVTGCVKPCENLGSSKMLQGKMTQTSNPKKIRLQFVAGEKQGLRLNRNLDLRVRRR